MIYVDEDCLLSTGDLTRKRKSYLKQAWLLANIVNDCNEDCTCIDLTSFLIIQNSGLHEITLSIIAINFSDDYVIIPYLYRFSEASVGFSSLGLAPIRLRSLGSVLTTRSALFRAIFSES